jgi:hypothetical protein
LSQEVGYPPFDGLGRVFEQVFDAILVEIDPSAVVDAFALCVAEKKDHPTPTP